MFPTLKNLEPGSSYLLAVSGGVDSMVMADLFAASTFRCAIAHCNFALRGEESDGDEKLVKDFAAKNGIPCFTIRFETEEYATQNGLSIQVAARVLRYDWFEKIRAENGFDGIAVAHNADDNVETFFINLIRGSGLNGLTGIHVANGTIVRPILEFSRNDINLYAATNGIKFREDSSNLSVKYLRNKIRHLALPLFDEIEPTFRKKAGKTIEYLLEANVFIRTEADLFMQRNGFTKNGDIYVSLEELRKFHSASMLLFYLLEPYGFRGDLIANVLKSVERPVSGKRFFSSSHCLLIDREYLVISSVSEAVSSIELFEDSHIVCEHFELSCETIEKDEHFCLTRNNAVGEFDRDRLNFPLVVRQIEPGDRFVPLGMNGKKKLSDFFIDLKLPQTEKMRRRVILSGEDIVWVVGLRQDDRFKITENTKKVFKIFFRERN